MAEASPLQAARSRHKALAAESRLALLEALGKESKPLDAERAARLVGLHRNTARVHLEQLADVGLVDRQFEDRSGPGRPRVLYSAARDAATLADPVRAVSGSSEYRQLASVLAAQLAGSSDAGEQAEQAGRRWASAFQPANPTNSPITEQAATAVLTTAMEQMGFSPVADERRIILRSCPFAELATTERVVICGVHLGMIKQMLEALDAPLAVDRLDALVQDDPLLCVVHLSTRPGRRPPTQRTTSRKESSTP
jgi:predicted ArsR family transcriptional regulator